MAATQQIVQHPAIARWDRWSTSSRNQFNEHWRQTTDRDPQMRDVLITIEVVFGTDTVVRVATRSVTTTSAIDGTVYHYQAGLIEEPDIETTTALGSQAASARIVNFSIPQKLVDVSKLISSGRTMSGVAEISLQVPGQDHDLRWVLLRGEIVGGVSWSPGAQSISLQVSDPRITRSLLMPETTVDTVRWPLAQDTAIGQRYPLVINSYKKLPCLRVVDDYAVTGLKFLVCAPDQNFTVDAVYVNGIAYAATASPYEWTVGGTHTVDGLADRVLLIDFSSSTGPWEDNDSVHADVSSSATATHAVDIIKDLLQSYTGFGFLGTRPEMFSTAKSRMGLPASPSVLVNAPVQALPFIESTLLQSYPMVHLAYIGKGIGPVVLDRRTKPTTGTAGNLTGYQMPLIERVTAYQETSGDALFNSFEFKYAYNLMDNLYEKVLFLDPSTSPACNVSKQFTNGLRPAPPMESAVIDSDAEATYIIEWAAAHMTLPSYYVEWTALPWLYFRYEQHLGANIVYTDPDVAAFTNVTATVEKVGYRRGLATIGLRVWHPFWSLTLGSGAS